MHRRVALALALLVLAPATGRAQQATGPDSPPQSAEPVTDPSTVDVFDLLRTLRGNTPNPEPADGDRRRLMVAFAPVIGAKPSSGALFGAGGNVAFYRGNPSTTHISSAVTSLTFSTKGQTSLTDRFTMFGQDDRWRLEGDQRFQWTSLETYDLGTSADTTAGVVSDFDFFRLHHTAYFQLLPGLFAGAGLYFDTHTQVAPREGAEAGWPSSPYVRYSETHGLPLDTQRSAGASVDLLWDGRDSVIN
ncbi:MAG TPA: hypothetical protein VIY56_08015, partial [Vicinamibacterales bacterium]